MQQDARTFPQRKRILFLWISSPILASLLLLTEPTWAVDDVRHELTRLIGALALFACIVGRCWAALHIGGKKNEQLVTSGPYARTRNPLYFFSSVGLAGIGLAFGSVTLGALFFCFSYLAFSYVIMREERTLELFFGEQYLEYVMLVPRFFPLPLGSTLSPSTAEHVVFQPQILKKTFWQAFLFLLALPTYHIVHYLHEADVIQPIIKLY
jgi:protein-S-isoprenylcysteine O-methyltransferase Ste14